MNWIEGACRRLSEFFEDLADSLSRHRTRDPYSPGQLHQAMLDHHKAIRQTMEHGGRPDQTTHAATSTT